MRWTSNRRRRQSSLAAESRRSARTASNGSATGCRSQSTRCTPLRSASAGAPTCTSGTSAGRYAADAVDLRAAGRRRAGDRRTKGDLRRRMGGAPGTWWRDAHVNREWRHRGWDTSSVPALTWRRRSTSRGGSINDPETARIASTNDLSTQSTPRAGTLQARLHALGPTRRPRAAADPYTTGGDGGPQPAQQQSSLRSHHGPAAGLARWSCCLC